MSEDYPNGEPIDFKCVECHIRAAPIGSGYCEVCQKKLDAKYGRSFEELQKIREEHNQQMESGEFMARVRASRAYLNHCGRSPEEEIFAFVSLFHPEKTAEEVRRISKAVREDRRR
jgi:hypothetical protein